LTVKFRDYYAILGVPRDASADQIRSAYRRKARELHPDVNRSPTAQQEFQELNEAHAALSDPEKRRRYDQLGAGWSEGAPFEPPPGFGAHGFHFDSRRGFGEMFGGQGAGGFSDFFTAIFGDLGDFDAVTGEGPFGSSGARRGTDVQAEIELELADLLAPGQRRMTLGVPGSGGRSERRTVTVNIPAGVRPGQRLRLAGLGGSAPHGGTPGDIYLIVRVRLPPGVAVAGDDVVVSARVEAPTAVVGGQARVDSPDGPVTVRIPAGTQPGGTLRLRGRGLLRRDGSRGDLKVKIQVTLPRKPREQAMRLWERLARLSEESGE
jgi:curved DNA-binding protein